MRVNKKGGGLLVINNPITAGEALEIRILPE